MRCPHCSFDSTRVVDSRLAEPGDAIRRRRECAQCEARFTTFERAEGVSLAVRKRDGQSEDFDRQKLLGGLLRAATKRPLQVQQLEAVVDSIEAEIRRTGGEAEAERIGELALRALIGLDRVAAIRFASVYREFESLEDFEDELKRLARHPVEIADQLRIGPVIDGAESPAVSSDPKRMMESSAEAPAEAPPTPFDRREKVDADQP